MGGNRLHFRPLPVEPMRPAKICPPPHLVAKTRRLQSFSLHPTYSGGVGRERYFDDIIPMGEAEVREALMAEAKRHRLWKSAVIKKMEFERLEMLSCLQVSFSLFFLQNGSFSTA